MKGLKKYRIEQETWDAPFIFCIGSDKQLTAFLNDIDPDGKWEESKDTTQGHSFSWSNTLKKIDCRRVVWIDGAIKNYLELLGVLSHEILHYVIETLRNKDVPLSGSSEEAYTYLFEYSLKQCFEKIKIMRS